MGKAPTGDPEGGANGGSVESLVGGRGSVTAGVGGCPESAPSKAQTKPTAHSAANRFSERAVLMVFIGASVRCRPDKKITNRRGLGARPAPRSALLVHRRR